MSTKENKSNPEITEQVTEKVAETVTTESVSPTPKDEKAEASVFVAGATVRVRLGAKMTSGHAPENKVYSGAYKVLSATGGRATIGVTADFPVGEFLGKDLILIRRV